jgi:serine/threonine-protein kinase
MEHEERLKAALADRYRIEREVGSGGMATVYLAEDMKHHRQVAVKVLDPGLAQTLGAERFLREIQTAANLRHPHILPVFDSGEADGFLFYVMPHVRGESLRGRLARERQLPVEDAVQITREIADALAYAHREGVIHRDVKPANIMLEEGHAVLADFGVAHAVAEAKNERITRTGTSLGTPAYMSPEQAAGEEGLDGRSDQYALGCVFYEMLAGHPPFPGAQVEAVLRKHLTEEPPKITRARPAVAEAVAEVINRALAKSPADRFRTAGEMAAALASTTAPIRERPKRGPTPLRVALGLCVLVAVVSGLWWMLEGPEMGGHPEGRPRVAVLPLANLSGLEEDLYFTEGIHGQILTQLSKIGSLDVISSTSAREYRDSPKNLRTIGEELRARYIAEGDVLRAGDMVRVNLQLIDAREDIHLWADSYDRPLSVENLLAIQTEIAQAIASALRAALTPEEEEELQKLPTDNLEAYDCYLRGRYFWHQRLLAGFDSAISYFNQAISLDPDYARAYAALAETYVLLPEYGGQSIPETLPLATAVTERALALDPDLAEAYSASGYRKAVFEWDWHAAERDYLRAIELNSDYATAHQWYAELLGINRRWDEALGEARRAVELDPMSPAANLILGVILQYVGRYDEAIPLQERALFLVPDWVTCLHDLAFSHVLKSDYAAAEPLFGRLAELTGSDPEAYRAYLAALSDTAKIPAAVTALRAPNIFSTISPADYLVHLGRFDEAQALLEQEYEARNPRLPYINAHSMYEDFRPDPGFQDLLRRMNLLPEVGRSPPLPSSQPFNLGHQP